MGEPGTEPYWSELSPVRLQELLLEHRDLDEFLAALAGEFADYLARWHVAGATLTVVRPRRQVVHAGSELRFAASVPRQTELEPAFGVLATGLPVVVRHLDPRSARAGGAHPLLPDRTAAFASVPVPVEKPAGAVLSVYSPRPGAFDPEAVRAVERAARDAAASLTLALRTDAQAHRAANLQAALESRTVVDLAAGIIMGQNNCSQQSAVDILRNVSNSRNVKVRDVAAGVVAVVSDRVSTHFEE